MARDEADREDLLREATALVERIELFLPTSERSVVAGFRRDGASSFFFDGDPVYQFNASGQLRRIYRGGLLYKAERGELVSLERRRTDDAVQLVRRDLTPDDTRVLLNEMRERLEQLRTELQQGRFHLVGQVPGGIDLVARVAGELTRLVDSPPVIAPTPRVEHGALPGRRRS